MRKVTCSVLQELGIQVLEINPGMDRTGAMLLRLIGEATQSHRVQWGSGGTP